SLSEKRQKNRVLNHIRLIQWQWGEGEGLECAFNSSDASEIVPRRKSLRALRHLVAACVFLLAAHVTRAAPTDTLVAYWSFERNTVDVAPSGSVSDNGTWVGTAAYASGPSVNTTYTITAANGNGTNTRDLRVEVTGQPIIDFFTATRTVVEPNALVILTWKARNSVSLDLNGRDVVGTTQFLGIATEDRDLDTLTALAEYGFGSSDTDPDDAPFPTGAIEAFDAGSGPEDYLTFSFARNLAPDDLAYEVQISEDLLNWRSGPGQVVFVRAIHNGNGTETVTCSRRGKQEALNLSVETDETFIFMRRL
ncbi:MAG: hypothetical protein O2960_28410, partial [Verrucomicrobia bacterium]|nr:hypothetical protein [Verrucomicrobiota bacterium]